jgi:hypothetical protein
LEDLKKEGSAKISYIKNKKAIVYTYPNYSFTQLLNQKIRWASKFKFNPNKLNFSLAGLVFISNLLWIILFFIAFFKPHYFNVCSAYLIIKVVVDFMLSFFSNKFIGNKNLLWYALPVSFIYPVYAVFIGLLSLVKKPIWK